MNAKVGKKIAKLEDKLNAMFEKAGLVSEKFNDAQNNCCTCDCGTPSAEQEPWPGYCCNSESMYGCPYSYCC